MTISAIRWELEPSCNLNCKHCFVGKSSLSYPKRIGLDAGLNILDNLHQVGVKELYFTTREPLLNPYICQYIVRCTEYGIKTSLITNGICLNDEQLVSKLINSGLCSISTSLEGPTAETNDMIRGSNSFDKALRGILAFQSQTIKCGKTVPINLQMSLNAYNSNLCSTIPTLIDNLPFDSLSVGALSNSGNAKYNQDIFLDDERYFDLFTILAKEYRKIKKPNYVLIFKSLMPWEAVLLRYLTGYDIYPVTPYCSILNGTYSMLSDGSIIPCISLYDKNKTIHVYGNENNLTQKLESAFTRCVEEIKSENETVKRLYCSNCYFSDRCFLCPALVNDEKMKDAALSRCIKAKHQFEKLIEERYKEGCYLKIDRSQVLYSYRELVFQKNYADSIKKEFRFSIESESDRFIEELLQGLLYRKQSFKTENKIIRSLILEGVIALRGGHSA